jgi:two-component system NtrC family sensor kinase
MKLALKLAVWLLLPMTVVTVVNAALRVQREHLLFDQETTLTHRALGRAWAAGIAEAGGNPEDHVRNVLRESAAQDDVRRLSWVPREEARWPPAVAAELAAHHEVVESADGALRTLYPIFAGGALVGAIAIEERHSAERDYLIGSIVRTAVQTALILALCVAAAVLAGLRLVGRPVQSLARHAHRVGEGDLTSRVDERFGDELDELARELNRMTAQLEEVRDRVARETQQKEQMLAQLRHADRLVTVGQLAAGIAHELGTPLNVALGRAQEIIDGDVTGDAARDSARTVVAQVERMTGIVRGLLDFARPRRATKGEVDAVALCERIASMLSSIAHKRQVSLQVEPAAPTRFVADGEQVEQVAVNLVMNGIQAMKRGGTIRLSVARVARAAPGTTGERRWCRLRIADEGEGIPPGIRDKIFDPFFTTKDPGEGTGLGLAVTWGLVVQNGGFLDYDSEVGRGTTFDVYLPQEAEA